MRPKTVNPEEYTSVMKNPGPGKYEKYETIDSKGKYFVSKYVTVINDMAFKELALKCPNLEHVCLQSCHVS